MRTFAESWCRRKGVIQSSSRTGACPSTTSQPLFRGLCSPRSAQPPKPRRSRTARYWHPRNSTSGARYSGVPQNVVVPPSLPAPVTPSCACVSAAPHPRPDQNQRGQARARRPRIDAFARGSGVPPSVCLGEPEIGHADVPLGVEQKVFRLQIPIHDIVGVQARDRKAHLRAVQLRARLAELFVRLRRGIARG